MDDRKAVVLFGASGHAKVVADILQCAGRLRLVGLLDDDPARRGGALLGYSILGSRDRAGALLEQGVRAAIVSIGVNSLRMEVAGWLQAQGFVLECAVHPASAVAHSARIGPGTVVMAGSVINPEAQVGANVIVNTGASIDHDCVIADHAHLAPGVRLCGGVRVGEGALVGTGACAIPGISIGAGAVVGAGSVLVRDVPAGAKVAGNPARELSKP